MFLDLSCPVRAEKMQKETVSHRHRVNGDDWAQKNKTEESRLEPRNKTRKDAAIFFKRNILPTIQIFLPH